MSTAVTSASVAAPRAAPRQARRGSAAPKAAQRTGAVRAARLAVQALGAPQAGGRGAQEQKRGPAPLRVVAEPKSAGGAPLRWDRVL